MATPITPPVNFDLTTLTGSGEWDEIIDPATAYNWATLNVRSLSNKMLDLLVSATVPAAEDDGMWLLPAGDARSFDFTTPAQQVVGKLYARSTDGVTPTGTLAVDGANA